MKKTLLPRPTRQRASSAMPTSVVRLPFLVGQTVQIAAGQLAGAKGVVVKPMPEQRWLVKLDYAEKGVLLSIRTECLRIALKGKGK